NGQRDVLDDAAGDFDDVAHVNHRNVRVFVNQVSLQLRAAGCVGGAFDRADEFRRGAIERPRAKDDQEPGARVTPINLTDVRDAGCDQPPLHVEGHCVTDVQIEFFTHQLLD